MQLIDAEHVVKNLMAMKENLGCNAIWIDAMIDGLLNTEPTIDAEPVRHGHWKETSHNNFFLCSECDYAPWLDDEFPNKTPYYCPSCGAKMDEVE